MQILGPHSRPTKSGDWCTQFGEYCDVRSSLSLSLSLSLSRSLSRSLSLALSLSLSLSHTHTHTRTQRPQLLMPLGHFPAVLSRALEVVFLHCGPCSFPASSKKLGQERARTKAAWRGKGLAKAVELSRMKRKMLSDNVPL